MKKLLLGLIVFGAVLSITQVTRASDAPQTPTAPSPADCKWPFHLVQGADGKMICVRAIHN